MINKKGISGVITTVLMIALVLAAVAIVWGVINNLVQEELGSAEACFGNFGKVTINGQYTCYNSSSNELQFSLSVGDIDVDEILVGISGAGTTKSFGIKKNEETISGIVNYPDKSSLIKLPSKNAGLTYILDLTASGFSGIPDVINIAPIINGQTCEMSDSLKTIDDCDLLA